MPSLTTLQAVTLDRLVIDRHMCVDLPMRGLYRRI
jgi:hypothetical protein